MYEWVKEKTSREPGTCWPRQTIDEQTIYHRRQWPSCDIPGAPVTPCFHEVFDDVSDGRRVTLARRMRDTYHTLRNNISFYRLGICAPWEMVSIFDYGHLFCHFNPYVHRCFHGNRGRDLCFLSNYFRIIGLLLQNILRVFGRVLMKNCPSDAFLTHLQPRNCGAAVGHRGCYLVVWRTLENPPANPASLPTSQPNSMHGSIYEM